MKYHPEEFNCRRIENMILKRVRYPLLRDMLRRSIETVRESHQQSRSIRLRKKKPLATEVLLVRTEGHKLHQLPVRRTTELPNWL